MNTSASAREGFSLDSGMAIEVIAGLWGLDADQPDDWRLERFGPTLGMALENLAGAVFAPTRGLLLGPDGEIRVYAIDDPYGAPLLVCLAGDEGPMLCTGIEDARRLLPESLEPSPLLVLEALRGLLGVATETWRERTFQPARPRVTAARGGGAGPRGASGSAVAVAYGLASPPD